MTEQINLGSLIRRYRTSKIDERTGRTFTQVGLAQRADVSRETIKELESGGIQTPGADIAAAICSALGINMVEFVNAMGYRVTFEGIRDEEEVEILEAWRRARENPAHRQSVRGALLLATARPPGERGRSLRRQVAMGRQDRQETLE